MDNLSTGETRVETKLGLGDLIAESHFRDVLKAEDDEAAQCLCDAFLPGSAFYGFQLWPNGVWSAVVLYDNLLHDGAGKDAADALLAALRGVLGILEGREEDRRATSH
jgi:hypothetical protein